MVDNIVGSETFVMFAICTLLSCVDVINAYVNPFILTVVACDAPTRPIVLFNSDTYFALVVLDRSVIFNI